MKEIPLTETQTRKNYTGPRPMVPLTFEARDGFLFTPALVEDCYRRQFELLGLMFGDVPITTLEQAASLPTTHERARRLAELLEG